WAGALYVMLASKSGFVDWDNLNYEMSYTQLNNSYYVPSIWQAFYESLNAANFAINGIKELPASEFSSEDKKNKLIAEARLLRAWINANLLWNFAHWWAEDSDEYGILFRDEVVGLTNVDKERISVGESYERVYEDIDYAIEYLD